MSPERRALVIAELDRLIQPGRRLDDAPWTAVRVWRRLADRAERLTGTSSSACYRKLPLIAALHRYWALVEAGDFDILRRFPGGEPATTPETISWNGSGPTSTTTGTNPTSTP